MIDPKKLEQLARKMQEILPQGIRDLSNNLEKKIHQGLQNQFSRMDLVSRKEFDIQTQMLLHTREKLSQLELRINMLETNAEKQSYASSAQPAVEVKPAGVTGMDDITNISLLDRTVPDVTAENKMARNIFKKL